jgi:two-component system chemotaxis response regulator CheB
MTSAPRNVVVIGASAGGIEALQRVIGALPADLDAAVAVVLHLAPGLSSHLHQILGRVARMPVAMAMEDAPLLRGRVYVARPDHHLLVEGDWIRVTQGPEDHRQRPAIDVLFRSAAEAYGECTVGVLLTGMLYDGTSGLLAIKERGGRALVQSPSSAEYDSMPLHALWHVEVDRIVPLDEMAAAIVQAVSEERASEPASASVSEDVEAAPVTLGGVSPVELELGPPSEYRCPVCNGMLLELRNGGQRRFRCFHGHAAESSSATVANPWA